MGNFYNPSKHFQAKSEYKTLHLLTTNDNKPVFVQTSGHHFLLSSIFSSWFINSRGGNADCIYRAQWVKNKVISVLPVIENRVVSQHHFPVTWHEASSYTLAGNIMQSKSHWLSKASRSCEASTLNRAQHIYTIKSMLFHKQT